MGLARSLVEGKGYTFNFAPHAMVPPGYPLMLAAVRLALGQNFWAMQAVSAVCGVGALLAVYGLVKARAGFWPALAIVLLTATNRLFVQNSSRPLSDMPYAFLSLAALWYVERELRSARLSVAGWMAATVLGLAAIYTSLRGVVLIPAALYGVLFARGRMPRGRFRWIAGGLLCVVWSGAVVFWVLRGWALPGQASYAGYHLTQARSVHYVMAAVGLRLREWAAAPFGISGWHVPTGFAAAFLALVIVPGIVKGMRALRGCAEAYLCAYFAMFALILGPDPSGEPHHDMRYAMPIVPLLFYCGYLTLMALAEWAGQRGRAPRLFRSLPVLAGSAMLVWGLAASAWWGLVIRPRDLQAVARCVASLEEAGHWARDHMAPAARVCTHFGNIVHFSTRRKTTELRLRTEDTSAPLRRVVESKCEFLVVTNTPCALGPDWRLRKVAVDSPECFELVHRNELLSVYRISVQPVAGKPE